MKDKINEELIDFKDNNENEEIEEYDYTKNADKVYIVLYYGTGEQYDEIKSFEIIKGRMRTYEFIKGIVEYIDIHESKVLTDNVLFDDSLSVYEFVNYVKNISETNDNFDIEDYNNV